eukprot:681228_1
MQPSLCHTRIVVYSIKSNYQFNQIKSDQSFPTSSSLAWREPALLPKYLSNNGIAGLIASVLTSVSTFFFSSAVNQSPYILTFKESGRVEAASDSEDDKGVPRNSAMF